MSMRCVGWDQTVTEQAQRRRNKALTQKLADVPMVELVAELGVSRARLQQIERNALRKLREELLRRGLNARVLLGD